MCMIWIKSVLSLLHTHTRTHIHTQTRINISTHTHTMPCMIKYCTQPANNVSINWKNWSQKQAHLFVSIFIWQVNSIVIFRQDFQILNVNARHYEMYQCVRKKKKPQENLFWWLLKLPLYWVRYRKITHTKTSTWCALRFTSLNYKLKLKQKKLLMLHS